MSGSNSLNRGGFEPLLPLLVVLHQGTSLRVVQAPGVEDDGADNVRVDVGGRASVLNVALALGVHHGGWDSEGTSSVSTTVGELGEA